MFGDIDMAAVEEQESKVTLDIVGLVGEAGVGKDFTSRFVLEPMGYKRFALADHLKVGLIASGELTYGEAFADKKAPWVRSLLQRVGTDEVRKTVREDYWYRALKAWLTLLSNTLGITKWVISDVRFPNEVEFLRRELGASIIRVYDPNYAPGPGSDHESEASVLDCPIHPHEWVINDRSKSFMEYSGEVIASLARSRQLRAL